MGMMDENNRRRRSHVENDVINTPFREMELYQTRFTDRPRMLTRNVDCNVITIGACELNYEDLHGSYEVISYQKALITRLARRSFKILSKKSLKVLAIEIGI